MKKVNRQTLRKDGTKTSYCQESIVIVNLMMILRLPEPPLMPVPDATAVKI